MPRTFRLVASLVLLFLGARTLHSEPVPRLLISTNSGTSTFHIGERIPLQLSFTGPDDKTFAIDLARYDRSGRMNEDTFHVKPESGWADPLAAYFRYGSYMGGGMRGGQYLSSKAVTIDSNLNEWVRFDHPGTYTLTVTSHRVGPSRKRWGAFPGRPADLSSSNRITLTIIPATREWQDETLSRILRDLPRNRTSDAQSQELSPAQNDAVTDLRFLATAKAARVLAAQLREDNASEWDAYFGLIGLPPAEREHALHFMRSLLAEPDFPVDRMFLEAMSWLEMPEEAESTSRDEMDRQAFEIYEQSRTAARDLEWQDLVLVLHEKKGAALHATETALLETQPTHPNPNTAAVLGAIVRASFANMSPIDQAQALKEHWDLIDSRELLPQIRDMAKASPVAEGYSNPFFSPRARIAVALRRWHELEPESAAAETIRQIGRAYPQLYAKEVSYLSEKSFPQFESLWAETLANGDGIDDYEPAASLLLRFGTGAVSARIMEILRNPKDNLGNRLEPALAYLLKFDPRGAETILQTKPGLLTGQMDSIAKTTSPSAFLTEAALQQLASSDETGTADALAYLRHFGDEHVLEPTYKAFLAWFERNKAVADKDPNDLSENGQARLNLGVGYASALLSNQGWLPDAKVKSDVLQHSIGSNMEQQVKNLSNGDRSVTIFQGDYASYEIGAFEAPNLDLFEKKLDQFPAGTKFTLQHVSCPDQHSQDVFEASLPELFLKHGMRLIMPEESTLRK